VGDSSERGETETTLLRSNVSLYRTAWELAKGDPTREQYGCQETKVGSRCDVSEKDCTGCAYWIRWIRRRRGLENCYNRQRAWTLVSVTEDEYNTCSRFDRGGAAQSSIYRQTRSETDTMQMSSTTSWWTVPRQDFNQTKFAGRRCGYGCTRRTTTAPVQFEKGRKDEAKK
jgi:hypothetical protein